MSGASASASSGPVFIGGADRSGLAVVSEMLESHPAFAISRRTNLWTFFYGRFGDLSDDDNARRCVDTMLAFTRIRALGVEPDELIGGFLASRDRSYFRLFDMLGTLHAERQNKPRWGDKSLNCELDAELILGGYPTGSMIHVVRDPRDRHASVATHRGGRRGGVFNSTAVWLRSARMATINSSRFPDRYLIVRYEDVVSQPDVETQRICEFLGVAPDPAMIHGAPNPERASGSEPLWSSSVGRYRRDLNLREIGLMDRVLGHRMVEFGYVPDPEAQTPSIRRRTHALDLPRWAVFLLLWTPWSSVKRRLAARPSRRRRVV